MSSTTPKRERQSLRDRWDRSHRYNWQQWRRTLFFVVMLIALLLGMWGFHHYPQLDSGRASWWTSLDATLQLFTLNTAPQDPMPLTLSIARFLAPLALTAGILTGLSVVYRSLTQESRAHRQTGHLLIIGCGRTAAGIAVQAIADGTACALVDLTAAQSRADELRGMGLPVLAMSTATSERFTAGELGWRLHRARFAKASDVVVATGSDSLNARVIRVIESKAQLGMNGGATHDWRGRPLLPETRSRLAFRRIYVETSTLDLSRWLLDVLPKPGIDLIEWFNIEERGARDLLDELVEVEPSVLPDPTSANESPYLVVFGSTQTAAAIAAQFCRAWACSTLAGVEATPRIGFVDSVTSGAEADRAMLDRVLSDWDVRSTVPKGSQCEWEVVSDVADLGWTDTPLAVVVAPGDDVQALGAVRAAEHEWPDRPIWVCPQDVEAINSYLDTPGSTLVNIKSLAGYAFSLDCIRRGFAEDLARYMQAADYLKRHRDAARLSDHDLANRLWGQLSEDERAKNRAAVEGWRVALDVLGYRIVRKRRVARAEVLDWIERDFVAEHIHEAWRTVMDERALWGEKAKAIRRKWEEDGCLPNTEDAMIQDESNALAADRGNNVAWKNLQDRRWNVDQAGLVEKYLSAYDYMLQSSPERIVLLDRIAEGYYDGYAARWGRPEDTPWSELGDDGRRADLGSARAALVYLHRLGFERVHLSEELDDPVLTDDDVEALARVEHERWLDSKRVDGWSLGPHSSEAKTHPNMTSWEMLSEEDRDKDRERITLLPSVVAKAGWDLNPRLDGLIGIQQGTNSSAKSVKAAR